MLIIAGMERLPEAIVETPGATATPRLHPGQTFRGDLDVTENNYRDTFDVYLEAGHRYEFSVTGITLIDPDMSISRGNQWASDDNAYVGVEADTLGFIPQESGIHTLEVYASAWPEFGFGTYSLFFAPTEPSQLLGTSGRDQILGSSGNDRILSLEGDDLIRTSGGRDTVFAGDGDDTISGGGRFATLAAGEGNDRIFVGAFATAYAGLGNDTVLVQGDGAKIQSGDGDDVVRSLYAIGDQLRDSYAIRYANIEVSLGRGNDLLDFYQAMNATVDGGAGDDRIKMHSGIGFGGLGDDKLIHSFDWDYVEGYEDESRRPIALYGEEGNDELLIRSYGNGAFGGLGDDRLISLGEDARLFGGEGHDFIRAVSGSNRLGGGDGDDTVKGGGDADLVWGGTGDDDLAGADGNDTISGGAGADRLYGGWGDDQLSGDGGRDVFVFSAGQNVVTDFETGPIGDSVDMAWATGITDFADLVADHATDEADGLRIEDDAGHVLFLRGVTIADLESASFLF